MQIPGYLEHQAALKAAGVEGGDGILRERRAVMTAWQKDQGADGVTFCGIRVVLTKALGMVLDHPPGPRTKGSLEGPSASRPLSKMVW